MNKLGFGFLRLPTKENGVIDWDYLNMIVDRYMEGNIRYFDTAYSYLDGLSEYGIKKCVNERYPREAFMLADKLPGYKCRSYDDCWKYFNEELERCGVEYFDVYMLHWLNGRNYDTAMRFNEFDFLKELKQKGLAKRIGFSYHDSASLLDRILTEHPEVDVVLIQINYLDWDTAGIESGKCYETCVRHGVKVMAMEPVKGGTLAKLPEKAEEMLRSLHPEWSPADWALRFVQSLPEVEICLSGMNTLEQVESNLQDFEPLSKDDIEMLWKIRDILESETMVPCTQCGYCVSHCPMGIPIPQYFKMFNEISRYPDEGWKIRPSYEQLALEKTKASSCISCHKCEENCPQNIRISEEIKKAAYALE